ncbi:hypothetical protein Pan97_33490 [Bremerella volcania]|uniref:Secreted protein n=1 Tax=Bremerella volcania TaxID=2527984 RepID=A0A518CAP5_9BACT|nr:hypothetical protein [Bremerella volcania]QDU76302.1 hypothetical protein Pan97_33490 [Bremerella volcania]
MKPRWLYLLLILALLLPATRPRLAGAMTAGSTPLQEASQGSNTQTEEEEVHERTASSRQTQRIARGSRSTLEAYSLPQWSRFTSARSGIPSVMVATHNGFGGNINC